MCLLFVSLWIMNNYTCIETRFNGTFNNCYGGKKSDITKIMAWWWSQTLRRILLEFSQQQFNKNCNHLRQVIRTLK